MCVCVCVCILNCLLTGEKWVNYHLRESGLVGQKQPFKTHLPQFPLTQIKGAPHEHLKREILSSYTHVMIVMTSSLACWLTRSARWGFLATSETLSLSLGQATNPPPPTQTTTTTRTSKEGGEGQRVSVRKVRDAWRELTVRLPCNGVRSNPSPLNWKPTLLKLFYSSWVFWVGEPMVE